MSENALEHAVSELKGVGPERAKTLADMHIYTIEDLLFYFPFRYDHYEVRDLHDIGHQERATVIGKVHSEPSLAFFRRKRSRLTVRLLIGRDLIKGIWFNQSYVKKKLQPGDVVTVTGKWDLHRQEIVVDRWMKGTQTESDAIVPIYSVKQNVTVPFIRRLIRSVLQNHQQQLAENLPESYIQAYKLMSRDEAVHTLHFPENFSKLHQARRRYVYEELLLFQLKMQMFKKFVGNMRVVWHMTYHMQRFSDTCNSSLFL